MTSEEYKEKVLEILNQPFEIQRLISKEEQANLLKPLFIRLVQKNILLLIKVFQKV